MSNVGKIFKNALKVGLWVGLAVFVVILLISNRSLKKDNEKQKKTIQQYENQNSGSGEQEQVPEEIVKEVEEVEYSTEETERLAEKIKSVEKRVEALEKGEQNSTTTVKSETAEETVKEVDVEESIKAYLSRKYPFNGTYYKEAGETQYYADTFCTQKLNSANLRFMSQTTDYTSAENGLSVICVLTDDWQIVYCTQSPYLVTEVEYDEINYQK